MCSSLADRLRNGEDQNDTFRYERKGGWDFDMINIKGFRSMIKPALVRVKRMRMKMIVSVLIHLDMKETGGTSI